MRKKRASPCLIHQAAGFARGPLRAIMYRPAHPPRVKVGLRARLTAAGWAVPEGEGSNYVIKVKTSSEAINNKDDKGGTYEIKHLLKAHHYKWQGTNKVWCKFVSARNFYKEELLNEQWVKYATYVLVTVSDEFDNEIFLQE